MMGVLVPILTLLLGIPVWASPEPATLSLQEALKKGFDYSNELKKAESGIKQAHADLDKTRGMIFPTINGTASASTRTNSVTSGGGASGLGGGGSAAGGTGGTSTATSSSGGFGSGENYNVGLSLTQPILSGGAFSAGLSLYKTKYEQARQNFFSVKQDTAANIIAAYYTLAQNQQQLEAAVQNHEVLKSYRDITARYEKIGRSRKMDRLQAEANKALALSDVVQFQSTLDQAQANIRKFFGEASGSFKVDFKPVINPVDNLTVDQAYDAALKNNPTIRVSELQAEQIDYNREVDLATDSTTLNLVGTAGYSAPDRPELFQSNSQYYSLGLNLVIPLFSGLTSYSKKRSYGEQSYQALRDVQIAKDGLRNQIETALDTLKSSRAQLQISQEAVRTAQTALDLGNKAYQNGTASSADVLNLQSTRYNSEKQFITNEFNYLNALLNLRKQMGIDLEKNYAK